MQENLKSKYVIASYLGQENLTIADTKANVVGTYKLGDEGARVNFCRLNGSDETRWTEVVPSSDLEYSVVRNLHGALHGAMFGKK